MATVVFKFLLLFSCSRCVTSSQGQELRNENTVHPRLVQAFNIPPSSSDVRVTVGNGEALSMCSGNHSTLCPPWFHCQSGRCRAGPSLPSGVLGADNRTVLDCYCVTYNKLQDTVEVGKCTLNCMSWSDLRDGIYSRLPGNVSGLNNMFCEKFNRQGTLCGQCKRRHFPLAYSFNMSCIQCLHSRSNVIRYAAIAFIPLTVFYFIILLFKVNIVSSHLYGFVIYSQAVSMPVLSRILVLTCQDKPKYIILVKIASSLYGVWNLDFFRQVDLGICLEISTLLNLTLDLLVAVYPLLLMIVTYLMIHLYDRNFRPLLILWRPFRGVFAVLHDNWDIRSSVIDSFATFFLLSNTKFLSVVYDLLVPVQVYELSSSGRLGVSLKLYYDASIDYFGSTHLPYAILAIVVLVVFVLLPVLILMLYPFRWFQKILNVFPVRWHVLHTFMDSFQGCYKDGTEPGTRDCRWFSSIIFIVRYTIFLMTVLATGSSVYPLGSIILTVYVLSLVVIKPFKAKFSHYSNIHATYFLFIALILGCLGGFDRNSTDFYGMSWLIFIILSTFGCLPLLFVSIITLQWVVRHRRFGLEVFRRWQINSQGYRQLQ